MARNARTRTGERARARPARGQGAARTRRDTGGEVRDFSRRLVRLANASVPRIDFLRELLGMLLGFWRCDGVEIWLREEAGFSRSRMDRGSDATFRIETGLEHDGSGLTSVGDEPSRNRTLSLVPIRMGDGAIGVLRLENVAPDHLVPDRGCDVAQEVGEALALAIVTQRAQADLRERVKELVCLYGIADLAARHAATLDDFLHGVVRLLPPAWQFPEIACARIVVDERSFVSEGFVDGPHRQRADLVVDGLVRGFVEVVYKREIAELERSPFLGWESHLIEGVARQAALAIERREAGEDRSRLEAQLRHADRLATIGQLAAGVAHELNEPLANILGFAQLARKAQGVPAETVEDIGRIEQASLYARDVILKLMLFARQAPQRATLVDLNGIVEDALGFLASRWDRDGVELLRDLAPDLPEIEADPSQLQQVLVNLVVNALQAMPDGGMLTIRTFAEDAAVALVVEDTGVGMSAEVRKRAFLPFFTTKDVSQGTGLGLSVVHGIVSAHGGTIDVESRPGEGSRFRVSLPNKKKTSTEE